MISVCFRKIVFLLCLSTSILVAAIPEKPIVILTTSYNNELWVRKCLRSISRQKYKNYRVIYVDDCSKDKTVEKVKKYVDLYSLNDRCTLIENKIRVGALANIYNSIHDLTSDDEIIVSLDGDDWLYGRSTLAIINKEYSEKDIWMTHGKLIEYPHGTVAWCLPIPEEIVKYNRFRTFRCPSHVRTFYSWLFKNVEKEDLQEDEKFYAMAWDQAMMFPMIEMAAERHAFIDEITYVYNMANIINDNKVDPEYQRNLEERIRSKVPYDRLENKDELP